MPMPPPRTPSGVAISTARAQPVVTLQQRARQLAHYGWQAHLVGDEVNAARAFTMASRKMPDDEQVLAFYAAWLGAVGRHKEALVFGLRAAKKLSDNLAVWCNIAESAYSLNEFTLAVEACERCCKLDPKIETPEGTRARVLAVRLRKTLQPK